MSCFSLATFKILSLIFDSFLIIRCLGWGLFRFILFGVFWASQIHFFSQIRKAFFFFLQCHLACGILVPWPGIKPTPPALEAQSLNHWTNREVPIIIFLKYALSLFAPSWTLIIHILVHFMLFYRSLRLSPFFNSLFFYTSDLVNFNHQNCWFFLLPDRVCCWTPLVNISI